MTQRSKAISIQGFYMDDTEITNNEYRQFIEWTRDSIALVMLDAYQTDEEGNGGEAEWAAGAVWSENGN